MAPRPTLRSSIEWKLPAMVGSVVVLVTAALAWAAYVQVRRADTAAAGNHLQGIAQQLVGQLDQQIVVVKQRTRKLTREPAILAYYQADSAARHGDAWLAARAVLDKDTTLAGVELWDSAGHPLDGSTHPATSNPTIARLLKDATGPDSAAIGPMLPHGDTILYPTVGLVVASGHRLGYTVQWNRIKPNAAARERVRKLFGSDAVIYIGSVPGAWTDQRSVVAPPQLNLAQPDKVVRYVRTGAGTRLAAAAPVPGSPWLVAAEFSDSLVLAPARKFLGQIVWIALVVFALGLAAAWALSRHITVPLRRLTDAADARATGKHDVRVVVGGTDELARLAGAFNDMSDHIDAEVQHRTDSEAQWRLLFRTNPHPMWVYDVDTLRFLAVNNAAIEKFGYSQEEFLAMTIHDLRADAVVTAPPPALADAPVNGVVLPHRNRQGDVLDVQIDANTLEFGGHAARLVLAQDVTERRVMEAQLRQGQRMEAVGRLAGGVAHDFNNLLTVVMTCTEMLQQHVTDGDSASADLESILDAAKRARGLTGQLLAVSRQQVMQPVVLDPNESVSKLKLLLDRVIGEDIDFRTELGRDIGMVRVDPGQLEQVLLNLTVNARDAMPSGGRLTVSTSCVELDQASSALHGLTQVGQFVIISVADTGIGMTAETRARIFDPFFTTKDVGKGTGLGLATVYGIVSQSGGAVTVYSEPGMGSTFHVYLPLIDVPAAVAAVKPARSTVRGNETILLVEDEAPVRRAITQVLERLGYTVVPTENGDAAMKQHTAKPRGFDLIISDVVMPGMPGPALIERLREQQPDLRALLLSGYSGDAVLRRGFPTVKALFLEKPFSLTDLSHKVREALEGGVTNWS